MPRPSSDRRSDTPRGQVYLAPRPELRGDFGDGAQPPSLRHTLTRCAWAVVGVLIGAFLIAKSHDERVRAERWEAQTPAWVSHTPLDGLSDWSNNGGVLHPPAWRGSDASLRWTQIGLTAHGTADQGQTNPWGGWFMGRPGEPLSVTVNAQEAETPLTQVTTHTGHVDDHHVVPATGPHPSATTVRVDHGDVTVRSNPDGTTTLDVPASPGQTPLLWVWATSATPYDQTPWSTQVNVGSASRAAVKQAIEARVQGQAHREASTSLKGLGLASMILAFAVFVTGFLRR